MTRYRDVYPYDHSRVPLVEVVPHLKSFHLLEYGLLYLTFFFMQVLSGGQHGLYQCVTSHSRCRRPVLHTHPGTPPGDHPPQIHKFDLTWSYILSRPRLATSGAWCGNKKVEQWSCSTGEQLLQMIPFLCNMEWPHFDSKWHSVSRCTRSLYTGW